MGYTTLYRKFRPQIFDDVCGQDHIVSALRNQISGSRIGHAYLFTGTRGTGKTTIAKIFAKAVNCEHPADGNPCGECSSCKSIAQGSSLSVIEIDGASNNGIDNIRDIIDEVSYPPIDGKYKVYIIDEVHAISTQAFQALLKTLEEPPEYVIFILATTEVGALPTTILSRCQRYDFHRISIPIIEKRLTAVLKEEGIEAEERAIRYVARVADGSMRDGLSLLDQAIAFSVGEPLEYDKILEVLGAVDATLFSSMIRCVKAQDAAGALRILDSIIMEGKEPTVFAADLVWYLRNLLLVKSGEDLENILDISTENQHLLSEEAELLSENDLMRYIRVLSDAVSALRFSSLKRVTLEIAIIRLCRPQMEYDYSSLVQRIEAIEKSPISNGATVKYNIPVTQAREEIAPPWNDDKNIQEHSVREEPETCFVEEETREETHEHMETQEPIVSDGTKPDFWGALISAVDGLVRTYLNMAVVEYSDEGGLDLIFNADDPAATMGIMSLSDKETNDDIVEIIKKHTGKTVKVNIKEAHNGYVEKSESDKVFVNERPLEHDDLEKALGMKLETEDF